MSIYQIFGGIVSINEGGTDGCASGQNRQQSKDSQHGNPGCIPDIPAEEQISRTTRAGEEYAG